MTSIFSETIKKAIGDYRYLLRRHLTQSERMTKLQKLNLKSMVIYRSDVSLYQVAERIIIDMEENMTNTAQSYYSYSGIRQFCQYLREYLDDYIVESDKVVHRARKASCALLQAIQLIATPSDGLNDAVAEQLFDCNQVVANFGSVEQWDLHVQALKRQQVLNPGFYTRIIAHFESIRIEKAAA